MMLSWAGYPQRNGPRGGPMGNAREKEPEAD
jgi:hypothetical protein